MDEALRHVVAVQRYIKLGFDDKTLGWTSQWHWGRVHGQVFETNY